jgi:hypothetical protein
VGGGAGNTVGIPLDCDAGGGGRTRSEDPIPLPPRPAPRIVRPLRVGDTTAAPRRLPSARAHRKSIRDGAIRTVCTGSPHCLRRSAGPNRTSGALLVGSSIARQPGPCRCCTRPCQECVHRFALVLQDSTGGDDTTTRWGDTTRTVGSTTRPSSSCLRLIYLCPCPRK